MERDHFSPDSKVWIYQSSRPFSQEEIDAINIELRSFVKEWTAHQSKLKSDGYVYRDRIIVLMVDETQAGASGCSIDTSVRFLKEIEKKYGIELFDRMIVNYIKNGNLETTSLGDISQLGKNEIVIDPLVQTKKEFDSRFLIPLQESWMNQYAG